MENSKKYRSPGLLVAMPVLALLPLGAHSQSAAPSQEMTETIWTVPEVGASPDDAYGRLVRHGRDLITATYAYIGPEVNDPSKRYAGNNLACGNCHLEAGTKRFGLPVFGLYDAFPRYSARAGAVITIEERVNSCMTRSMNGRSIPNDAPEMAAFVAYLTCCRRQSWSVRKSCAQKPRKPGPVVLRSRTSP
jgi:thiosulfate dehydrogenase